MASISQVAGLLGVDRDTVKQWTREFAEHLSLTASTPGKPRQFNESDLRVLGLVGYFWDEDPDIENIHAMLNAGEQHEERYVEFGRLHSPVFQDVPDDIDETWQHVLVVGGVASIRHLAQVARSYKLAADELVAAALSRFESHEIDYPIIYLYRHVIELYLKAILRGMLKKPPPRHHDLNSLIELVERHAGQKVAGWIGDRIRDFHEVDRRSDVFRYADWPDFNEVCVNLHQLKAVMDRLVQAFESHTAVVRADAFEGGG